MKRAVRFSVLFLAVLGLMACATTEFRTNSYKTLASSAAVYESGYPAFLELHRMGLVTDAQKATGKALAIKYWAVYHAAADALIAYDAVSSADNAAKVGAAIAQVQPCLENLSAYIQPFLKGGK